MKHAKTCMIELSLLTILVAGCWISPALVSAHCDSLDGPVVKAAQEALRKGDPAPALIWIQKQNEQEVLEAFRLTLTVRKLGPEAQAVADNYFFEILVRLHRAGEGAAYDGLKPAGRNLGPAIPAADRSLAAGSLEPAEELLTEAVRSGLRRRFDEAAGAKNFGKDDVEGGRRYVAAYVSFVHYVEALYEAAAGPAGEHAPVAETAHPHDSH
jgi:hypothetical protein